MSGRWVNNNKFSKTLGKLQKERILRLKQILFELYTMEQNKSRISKLINISPQTIGPDLDLLEASQLIIQVREEHTKGIPSTFYKTNINYIADALDLEPEEISLLLNLIEIFRPIYSKLKGYQREILEGLNSKPIEEVYDTIIPLNLKMFALQFIISILLFGAIFFHNQIPFLSKFEEDRLPIIDYKLYASRMKLQISYQDDDEIIHWLDLNFEAIIRLYEKIWNRFYRDFFFTSIFKEPLLGVVNNIDKIKENQIRELIGNLKTQKLLVMSSEFKKIADFKSHENQSKQKMQEALNQASIIAQKAMKQFLNREDLLNKFDGIRSRISALKNQLPKLVIGEGTPDLLRVKSQVLNILLVQTTLLSNLCVKLEENFEHEENLTVLLPELDSIISNLTILMNYTRDISPDLKSAKALEAQLRTQFQFILNEFRTPIKKSELSPKEYFKILEDKLLDLGDALKAEAGGLVSFPDLYQHFKKRFPEVEIDLNDLRKGINTLQDQKLIVGIKKVKSGVEVVRFQPPELAPDQNAIIEIACETGKLTVASLMDSLNWSQERTRQVLADLESSKLLYRTSSASEGEVWYLKGIIR